jgi:hypothetical protein
VRPFRWTAIALPFLPLAYLDQQLAPLGSRRACGSRCRAKKKEAGMAAGLSVAPRRFRFQRLPISPSSAAAMAAELKPASRMST